MSELLVGTVGWQGDDWEDDYYPEELPEDWRFCFYSNNLRTVLLPEGVWASRTEDEIADWPEDCDPGFRFVIEFIPDRSIGEEDPEQIAGVVESFAQKVQGIADQWDATLLSVPGEELPAKSMLAPWLEALLAYKPVCIHFHQHQGAPPEWLAEFPVTVCWDTEFAGAPVPCDEPEVFMVALTAETDPRKQREIIESLISWMGADRRAALFFRGRKAATRAEQARLIGEMLGA